METQLSQIVQEEIKLSKPGAEGILDHARKERRRFRFRFIRKQSFLDVADGIGVHARDIGGGHQRQQMKQRIAVLPDDIESLRASTHKFN